ncbi:MAG TPA: response regulator transcription factor [Bacteroidales bacterium]|nr:response regulator transcription factor [Bacteroidales bacterium]
MKQKKKILYVEDELSLGRIVSETLTIQGYDVRWETHGGKVLSHFEKEMPDVCVLDIMLPHTDGFSLCKSIKSLYPALPVIFLTAKTDTSQVIAGFESGGTDYIRKPFSIEELIARIENQLNLVHGRMKDEKITDNIILGKFKFKPSCYELVSPSRTINLSNRDMQLLSILYTNRNGLTLRKNLLLTIWGDDSYFNSRNLDVYIRKLRNYFAEDPSIRIITLKGSGYIFLLA